MVVMAESKMAPIGDGARCLLVTAVVTSLGRVCVCVTSQRCDVTCRPLSSGCPRHRVSPKRKAVRDATTSTVSILLSHCCFEIRLVGFLMHANISITLNLGLLRLREL